MALSSSQPAHWQTCCLLRLSALGDVSHALALVRALQSLNPDMRLTWIIGKREHQLVEELTDVRFIIFDKRAGAQAWRQLKAQLSGQSFDLLLHLQTSLRANMLSSLIRARRRIGWDPARAREGHRWFINESIKEQPPQHQVQGYLAFARHLGYQGSEPVWNLPVTAPARQAAEEILPGQQQTLLISPCSSHALRDWHCSGYQQVARYAIEQLGMRVILCGGPSQREREIGEAIAKDHPMILNWIGRDTLPLMLALLERASLVLSPDSGPSHLANALGTSVIALHAATWSQRSGPYGSLNLCVDEFEQAAQIYRHRPAQSLRWGSKIELDGVMDLIKVEAVIDRLKHAYSMLNPGGNHSRE